MFVKADNKKIGKYLSNLIEQKYEVRRDFCRDYLKLDNCNETDEASLNNMSNRITQIIKGNKGIQTRDLQVFTHIFGVSCEEILSAGECIAPVSERVTNYYIARSKDQKEWERYINHKDKLILNSDEYCKTVLDYALDFGNYEFIKFLMDNEYIWFDGRKDNEYLYTFGAGTSIQRRRFDLIDYGLEGKLKSEDDLRLKLIALAADNKDLKMLNELRARETPQLYFKAHYPFSQHPDFEGHYIDRMVQHISKSNIEILDYFTQPFEIEDGLKYSNGNNKTHTFIFPYISKLLDLLVVNNSKFASAALKKSIKYNKNVLNKLNELILHVKNDECFSKTYMQECAIKVCQDAVSFYDNGDIVSFFAIYSKESTGMFVTNIAKLTKTPNNPILKQLAEELNESYEAIRNIKEHMEEI